MRALSLFDASFDRVNAAVAAAVLLVVGYFYLATMAVTMTFWDCGEFIACCHVLGIPHPPGTPLFVIIGRLFAILPFLADAGARINFLSVVCSTLAAMVGYLCAVRILRTLISHENSLTGRAIVYAGSAAGALFLAFGKTQWTNAGEAEVYGMSMLLFMLVLWLALIYFHQAPSPNADRTMVTAVFLAFLGIGVHMTTFLVLPICALVFAVRKGAPPRIWLFAGIYILAELYLIFSLSSRPREVPPYVPIALVTLFYLMYLLARERVQRTSLLIGGVFLVAIAPLYGVIGNAVSRAASGGSGSYVVPRWLELVGWLGLAGVVVLSIGALLRARRAGHKGNDVTAERTAAGFGLAAAAMALLAVSGLRGPLAFLLLSIPLTLILALGMRQHLRWAILIAILGASLVMVAMRPFLAGVLAAAALLLLFGRGRRLEGWATGLTILLVAVIGFSVHLFLPVRSAEQPAINQNNPSQGLTATVNFLERKQYGSESMVTRMFTRRGEWENQFGNYRRMGFWRFFADQFGLTGPKFALLFVLGLFGLWEVTRRHAPFGILLTMLVVVASIGLVLYMNFADGTRQLPSGADYIEVRDRDYFFTPAFMLFGLAIGIGLAVAVQAIREAAARLAGAAGRVITVVAMALFVLPVTAIAGNYHEMDRSRNTVAHDYAWNLLSGCAPNAVLFTYGDNDTFPLWSLQEAYGIRNDVKVVNITLAGMKWYVKQVQSNLGVDMGWTDKQIDDLRAYYTDDGTINGINDQMVAQIIDRNVGRRPVLFSVTVPTDARTYRGQRLDPMLELRGLTFEVRPTGGGLTMDLDAGLAFLRDPEQFRLRGLADSTIFKDDNQTRLTANYSISLRIVADTLIRAGRFADAEALLRRVVFEIPHAARDAMPMLVEVYEQQGKVDALKELVPLAGAEQAKDIRASIGRTLMEAGRAAEADSELSALLGDAPTYRPAFDLRMALLMKQRQRESIREVLSTWVRNNPHDQTAATALRLIDSLPLDSVIRIHE